MLSIEQAIEQAKLQAAEYGRRYYVYQEFENNGGGADSLQVWVMDHPHAYYIPQFVARAGKYRRTSCAID